MKYDFNTKEITYPCIHKLLEDILDNLNIGSEEFTSVTVVADEYLTKDLLKLFLQIEVEGFEFTPEMIDINTIDYDDLYYFDINNDGSISVNQAWLDGNEYHDDMYAIVESDVIFVCVEDIDDDLLDAISENNIVIFDIDGECE